MLLSSYSHIVSERTNMPVQKPTNRVVRVFDDDHCVCGLPGRVQSEPDPRGAGARRDLAGGRDRPAEIDYPPIIGTLYGAVGGARGLWGQLHRVATGFLEDSVEEFHHGEQDVTQWQERPRTSSVR
ncbi:hypothetical protein ON010_g9453 [Phytophthora cinnamomi]|nr:hypothetical protein ON010_g9453 [Phytophthora cinnamomi]